MKKKEEEKSVGTKKAAEQQSESKQSLDSKSNAETTKKPNKRTKIDMKRKKLKELFDGKAVEEPKETTEEHRKEAVDNATHNLRILFGGLIGCDEFLAKDYLVLFAGIGRAVPCMHFLHQAAVHLVKTEFALVGMIDMAAAEERYPVMGEDRLNRLGEPWSKNFPPIPEIEEHVGPYLPVFDPKTIKRAPKTQWFHELGGHSKMLLWQLKREDHPFTYAEEVILLLKLIGRALKKHYKHDSELQLYLDVITSFSNYVDSTRIPYMDEDGYLPGEKKLIN